MPRNTAIRPIKYGTTEREILSIGKPVIPEATNKFMATGGVIMPIAMPTTNKTPKCIVETPRAFINGRKTGVSRIIALEVSMKTPAVKIIIEIRSMIIYLFDDTESTALEIVSGIFQLARHHPKGPEHAIIIMITALVLAEPSIISNRLLNVKSRYIKPDTSTA